MKKFAKILNRVYPYVIIFIVIALIVWALYDLHIDLSWEGTYPCWRQDSSNIEKVEICAYHWQTHTRTVMYELSDAEQEEIISELRECTFRSTSLPPPSDFGQYIICLVYYDGEIDVVGLYESGYISPDGSEHRTGYVVEDFDIIVEKYVDLPD